MCQRPNLCDFRLIEWRLSEKLLNPVILEFEIFSFSNDSFLRGQPEKLLKMATDLNRDLREF